METLLAIDVGGTHQRFAAINSKGKILEKVTYPSHRNISSDEFFQTLKERITDSLKKNLCEGVALALPIVIDKQTGKVQDAPHLPFLNGVHVDQGLSFLSIPWVLENDANCALLGEVWLGQGKEEPSFCCLTLGTGIGSGLFLNRELWKGVRGMASEMGHLKIDFSGKTPCCCGNHGCLEAFVSATALQKKTGYKAQELYQMASRGNPIALSAFEHMGECLGRGIGSVANLLNIDLFILAGRLSQAFQFFYPSCHRIAQESAMKGPRQHLRIVQSKLGDDAGLLGAAFLMKQKLRL
ncbi:MAG: ROK family protein [Deltaproteobacteria bacterium]|nr:ROK family protein [Deltaproteobacteria bacterium]